MKFCPCYVGVACVDGSCPIALQEQYADIYEDAGIPIIKKCSECHLYYGCLDCAFVYDERYCPKFDESEGDINV